MARGWSIGFFIAGVAAIGSGLLVGGIVAAAAGSAAGLTVAGIIAGVGVATGLVGLWESRRFRGRAERLERTVSEQRLYALAEEHGGVLRVADVASALTVMRSEAEELLDQLVDEVRVSMQVTDDGEIHYVFREVVGRRGPRVRVASLETEVEEEMQVRERDTETRSND